MSKTIMFFCFNNKLNKRNKSDCWNQWTLAFTEWNEFSRDTQHVDVERFVSFAERLRSLSYFVDLFYWFHSLLNNNVLKWKSRVSPRTVYTSAAAFHLRSLLISFFQLSGKHYLWVDIKNSKKPWKHNNWASISRSMNS